MRKLISFAGAFSLALVVVACGGKQTEPTTPPPAEPEAVSPEGGDGYGAPTPDTAPAEAPPPVGAPPPAPPPPANPCGN
jgi:hypothetical protein